MNFACPKCRKQLSVPDEKLPASPFPVKCPQCTHPFTVDPRANPMAKAAAPAAPAGFTAGSTEEEEPDDFGEKAMIVGADSPAVRQAIGAIGLSPIHMPTAEAARDYFVREYPRVAFIVPQQLTPPPLNDFAPLLGVSPLDRRRGFFVLVADNLRTFDGNAAFLYGVNLIVASKDLAQFPVIYRDAWNYHNRLYSALNAAVGAD